VKKHPGKLTNLATADIVPIVGDASIAGQVAEGVNIPLVILDTSKRSDIAEIIRAQEHLPPGDVTFRWAGVEHRPDEILLILDFERPIEARAMLRFSIESQGILIETALTAKAIYLQAGNPGDRLIHDPNRPKMLIGLPDVKFDQQWDELFLDRMTNVVSRRHGLSRRQAEPLARELIENLRILAGFRMTRSSGPPK
jgi:hypothetical protein